MTYNEALEVVNNNQNIIGKRIKGARIDEILIHPLNSKQWEEFSKSYVQSLNAQNSLLPYLGSDLGVSVVLDKQKIRSHSIFFYTSIDRALNEQDIE
jgi:hypothetical protein